MFPLLNLVSLTPCTLPHSRSSCVPGSGGGRAGGTKGGRKRGKEGEEERMKE